MVSELTRLQKEIHDWAHATFATNTVAAKIEHMQREMKELAENPSDPMEMADIQILLLGIAEMQGIDLFEATQKKFEIVKKRKWGQPDELGVVHHLKE